MAQTNSIKPLTTLSINGMKPGVALIDAGEYRGLRVQCGKSGVKTFIYRYRSPVNGKIKQYRLGRYQAGKNATDESDGLSLAEARVQFLTLKAQRDAGVCLVERKKAQQSAQVKAQATPPTVVDAVSGYLTKYIDGVRTKKSAAECRRALYGDLNVLAPLPLTEVGAQDVLDAVMGIVNRGANVQAGFFLRELTAVFDTMGEMDDANPCDKAKRVLKKKKIRLTSIRGDRVLDSGELSAFLRWLPGSKFAAGQKAVMRFTLLTGCRTGEVCALKWSDLDLDAGIWRQKINKTKTPRNVQLSRQAVAFLRAHQSLSDADGSVFTNIKGDPVQQKSLGETAWRLRRDGHMIALPAWSAHDLRRTVGTGLSELGCLDEVVEAVLGHSKAGVKGTYNLNKHNSACREWLQRWADHLEVLTTTDKVVSLRTA
jgi:integrase